MVIFKVLKATCVNLWHTNVVWVLRGAELKSPVCPAQQWPIMSQNREIQDGRHRRAHLFLTKQGRNLIEMCFCGFSYMGNLMPYSVLR